MSFYNSIVFSSDLYRILRWGGVPGAWGTFSLEKSKISHFFKLEEASDNVKKLEEKSMENGKILKLVMKF